MPIDESWAVGMRAEALAKLLLTERDDLELLDASPLSSAIGYDFLVRIKNERSALGPEFAVEVKGFRPPLLEGHFYSVLNGRLPQGKDSELPVVLFVFDVESKDGYYRWLYEPVVNMADGLEVADLVFRPPLSGKVRSSRDPGGNPWVGHLSNGFERLDDQAVGRIVEQVRRWSMVSRKVLTG